MVNSGASGTAAEPKHIEQPVEAVSTEAEYGHWHIEGQTVAIRYRTEVLRQICARAAEGFSRIPRGGIEVGGVLYGRREGREVLVEDWSLLECEYHSGPSFQLSETDHERLAAELRSAPVNRAGLEPVGWWHSHTRSDVHLSSDDVAVYDRHFPLPWQIAAVVRPAKFEPTRVGFFVREEDGSLRADSSHREIVLPKRAKRTRSAHEPGTHERDQPGLEPAAIAAGASHVAPAPGPLATREPSKARRWVLLFAIALCALAAAWLLWPAHTSDPGLRISGTGETVSIEWNGGSELAQAANGVVLEIREAPREPRVIRLSPEQLASGKLFYMRGGPEITVRMRVQGPEGAREYQASFVGPAVHRAELPPAVEAMTLPEPQEPPQQRESPANAAPERQRVSATQSVAAVEQERARRLTLPPRRQAPAPRIELAGMPPAVSTVPELGQAPAALGSRPVPPPPAPRETVRPRPASAGRAIWTGELPPGAQLTIEGNRASFGNITGTLPSGAARVSVRAAAFSGNGLVIYSTDERHRSREGTFESPSARNGWNLTTYKWDPERARSVAVVESAGRDGTKRLAIRSQGRRLSVVVLDWEETPPAAVR